LPVYYGYGYGPGGKTHYTHCGNPLQFYNNIAGNLFFMINNLIGSS
jgi:hypothetical protein